MTEVLSIQKLENRMMLQKDKCIRACKEHTLPEDFDVVIKEPYVPFIPAQWNGMLVLAESQNLSKKNAAYVEDLEKMEPEERFFRLKNPDHLGIQPWDDGSLKLAVQSAFNIIAKDTAVSNSVVWSQVTSEGNNTNPSEQLIEQASSFWREFLPIISPKHIVTSGKIAQRVIDAVNQGSWQHTRLRLPSPNAMSRISGMFPEEDLLFRYPEVKKELDKHPEIISSGYRQNKIFFACHAVAVAGASSSRNKQIFPVDAVVVE